jgi:hypothetical protein
MGTVKDEKVRLARTIGMDSPFGRPRARFFRAGPTPKELK